MWYLDDGAIDDLGDQLRMPVRCHYVEEFGALDCIAELCVAHGVMEGAEVRGIFCEILEGREWHGGLYASNGTVRIPNRRGGRCLMHIQPNTMWTSGLCRVVVPFSSKQALQ
jgi:hypothetical protein